MPVKTLAIVLFVKNEARDLPSWLAWHATMGCDTFIIYDDHSQDGTWELIGRASRRLDIRAARTDLATLTFTDRQKSSYLDAFRRYGAEFEWLAFIDADEFLSTEYNESLPAFLDSFPDAHAVALNWCNYGSNGHALRPCLPIIEAFVKHSTKGEPINRHVKSIVRPSKHRGPILNVHYFDVDDDYYVDGIGRRIQWSATRGIIADAPDWFGAKIMHFQCRSMEHFISRLKLRPDVPSSTETWRHYDLNDIEDVRFRPLLGAFHRHYAAIGTEIDALTIRLLKERIGRSDLMGGRATVPEAGRTIEPGPNAAFLVRTCHDTYLCCGDRDHLVRHRPLAAIDGRDRLPVIAIVPTVDRTTCIVAPLQDGAWLDHDDRRGPMLAYRIRRLDGDAVNLVVPHTNAILSAVPEKDADRGGDVAVDRRSAGDWETMTLVPLPMTPFGSARTPDLTSLPDIVGDAGSFLDWVLAVEPDVGAPAFNMVVQALSRSDRQAIENQHDVVLGR